MSEVCAESRMCNGNVIFVVCGAPKAVPKLRFACSVLRGHVRTKTCLSLQILSSLNQPLESLAPMNL